MEDFNSKYTGEQVEELLDMVANGEAGGGGGGITEETDPIFSASPAASITEDDIRGWNSDHTIIEDLNIDVAQLVEDVENKQDALVSGESIKTINGESILGEGNIEISGGNGGITEETDPIFSASPAASITEDDKKAWNNMVPYSVKDFSMVSADGFMTSDGDGFVFPNTPAAQAGQGFVLATLDDVGVGVQSVEQTTTSNADGGSNIVTVTLTDGTESTFTVKNGSKGSQGEKGDTGDKGDTGANGTNGTDGKDGADGEDGATFTPSVDSAGNLSWSNNKGLVNPPTVNIKGPKGDSGSGDSGGSGGGPNIEYPVVEEIAVMDNTIYLMGEISSLTIYPAEQLLIGCLVRFWVGSNGCELSIVDCTWANGIVPEIQPSSWHELSLADNDDGELMAVLTHFR